VLLALVASSGGAVYAYNAYRDGAGPDGAVRAYFHALASGDAPAALASGAIPAGNRAYLTDAVLSEQLKLAPIRDVMIVSDDRAGGHAKVSYSYDLAFKAGDLKASGTVGVTLVGSHWRLDAVAVSGTYYLNDAVDRASFGGTGIPPGPVLLFPGAVPLTFDTPYLRLSLSSEAVQLGASGEVGLATQLTGAAMAVLHDHLERLLTACVQVSATAASDCPVPPANQYVPGTLRGKVTLDDSDLDVSMNADPAGGIVITGTATFTGSYRELAFDNVGQDHTGVLALQLNAVAYAVAPLTVRFVDAPGGAS
jgi:hypothetical protein